MMSRKVTNKAMGGTVYMGLILLHINKLDTNQKREKKNLPGALESAEAQAAPGRGRSVVHVDEPLGPQHSAPPQKQSPRAHWLMVPEDRTGLWKGWRLGRGGAGRGRGSYTRRSQIYETASIPYLTLEVVHEGDAKKARQSDSWMAADSSGNYSCGSWGQTSLKLPH